MNYINKMSNLSILESEEFKTKLNTCIRDVFPDIRNIVNDFKGPIPFVHFSTNRVLVDVYKDIYRIENEFERAIQFKERFEEIQLKNNIGSGRIEYQDEHNQTVNNEFIIYTGYYSCYLVLLEHFFFCYFIKEIRAKDNTIINSLLSFLQKKKLELAHMPYNYFIQNGVFELKKHFEISDVKEYVSLVIEFIDSLKKKSVTDVQGLDDLDENALFTNSQVRELFYFLVQKNKKKKNDAFFSKLHRYYKSRGFWKNEKPKSYFDFLKEKDIYQYNKSKIQTPTTTNEEDTFIEFDKVLDDFLLNQ